MKARLLAWVIAFVASTPLCAQESRGTIIGRVSDPTGAVVAGARIQVLNVETNIAINAMTNSEGNYEVPYLVSGLYRLTVQVEGFKKSVREGIQVRVSDRLTIDFQLAVGDISDLVTVTAEAPLVDTASGSVGTVIDGRRATELPIAGGNAFNLARFTPGLISTGGHAPGNPTQDLASGAIAVAGTRTGSNEVTLDGLPITSRGQSTYTAPPQDMVEEFRIQTATYDASLGHTAGAVVNVTTKGGTNQLHGTGYYLDSRIRAVPWFSNRWLHDPATGPITEEKRRQANPGWLYQRWGGTANGPLFIPKLYQGRNKSFWSFGYEGMSVRRQATYIATFPTAAGRNGDFSALLKLGANYQIYNPRTATLQSNGRVARKPFDGNIIPATQIDPIAKKILSYWPEPNVAGTADFRDNYFKVEDETWHYKALSGRVDHNFSERHRFFVRLSYSAFDQRVRSFPSEATGTNNNPTGYRAAIDDVYVFSPTLLLNVRYGLVWQRPKNVPLHSGFDFTTLGFPQSLKNDIGKVADLNGLSFPQISVDGYAGLGGGGGSRASVYYHTFGATLTRIMGAHSLKMGGEYRLMRDNGFSYGNVAPSFTFSTNWTRGPLDNSPASPIGQGLASLLVGLPTAGSVSVNASNAQQSHFSAFYIQDDWKVSRRLSANLGLRYELESSITERFERSILDYDFNTPSPVDAAARVKYAANPIPEIPAANFRAMGGLTFVSVNGRPRNLWPGDKNNFMPRIGIAYQILPKTVLRAGYGIFFGLLGVDRNAVNQGGFSQSTSMVPSLDLGLTFRATLANPFPDGIQAAPGASLGMSTYLGRGISFFDQKPANNYMQRWSFSIQNELPGRFMVEISYLGNRGTKLALSQQYDPIPARYLSTSPARDQATIDYLSTQVLNPFYGMTEFTGTGLAAQRIARSQLLRPYPHFTSISAGVPNGYSWYHSMQLNVEKRMSHGVLFQAAWTWSKLMEATSMLNDSDPLPYETISDLDATHRFVVTAIYELPFGRGRMLLSGMGPWWDRIVGGWQCQGVYEGQSGFPLGFGNAIFNGSLHNIGIPVSARTAERWFNTDAGFERSSARQLANNIRTFPIRFSGVRNDGINNFDLSLLKNVQVTEKVRVQFRFEAINALNHVQFSDPNTTPTSTSFGVVSAERGHGQRQLNIVLKAIF